MLNRRNALRLTLGATASLSVVDVASAGVGRAARRKTVKTRLSNEFNVKHPFVCAGMAFVCDTSSLAIAVGESGAIGCLAGTLLSPQTLGTRIQEIKSATANPFHVNFLAPFPHDDHVRVCIDQEVSIVSFHWGFTSPANVARLHAAGISVWAQVGSVEAAQQARDAGADCIIAQGSEAGGHNYGGLPLGIVLPSIREALGDEVMLLAAGGISDGRTSAAAFAAGADGLWVGTRMIATIEANAHNEHKTRLVKASGEETIFTSVYGPENPGFNPIRVIRNATVDEWNSKVDQLPKDRSDLPSIGTTIFAEQEKDVKPFDSFSPVPETTGDFEQMPMMSGQGVGLINEISPAKAIISEMMHEAALSLRKYPG